MWDGLSGEKVERRLSYEKMLLSDLTETPRVLILCEKDCSKETRSSLDKLSFQNFTVRESMAPINESSAGFDFVVWPEGGGTLLPSFLFLLAMEWKKKRSLLFFTTAEILPNEKILHKYAGGWWDFAYSALPARSPVLAASLWEDLRIKSKSRDELLRKAGIAAANLDALVYVDLPGVLHARALGPEASKLSAGLNFTDDFGLGLNTTFESAPIGDESCALPRLSEKAVSAVIPFKNQSTMTIRCLEALSRQRGLAKLQVVLVDHESGSEEGRLIQEKAEKLFGDSCVIIRETGAFNFARLINSGVRHSVNDLLLILNNDVEVPDPETLQNMARFAALRNVATVGIQLLYPGGSTQFGGFTTQISHFNRTYIENVTGPEFFPDLIRSTPGNTFACAMVKKSVYGSVGGLDEATCPNGVGDVVFGLKCLRKGLKHVYLGPVKGIHHESISRKTMDESFEIEFLQDEFAQELLLANRQAFSLEPAGPRKHPHRYLLLDKVYGRIKPLIPEKLLRQIKGHLK